MNPPLIYLATPYTHSDEPVMEARYDWVTQVAGVLVQKRFHVFSPITHCHPIRKACACPPDFTFWGPYNRRMIKMCDATFVVAQEGWSTSKGVREEMYETAEADDPIVLVIGNIITNLTFSAYNVPAQDFILTHNLLKK